MAFINPPFLNAIPASGAGSVIYNFKRSPFTAGDHVELRSVGAAIAYGANHPGTLTTAKYVKVTNDAAQSSLARATYTPTIPAYPTTVAASLTVANILQANVIKNGVLLVRVGSDASPSAGQFQCSDANTLTFGDALVVGDVLEVFILLTSTDITQFTGGTLVASTSYDVKCTDFIANSVAVLNVSALPRGN